MMLNKLSMFDIMRASVYDSVYNTCYLPTLYLYPYAVFLKRPARVLHVFLPVGESEIISPIWLPGL